MRVPGRTHRGMPFRLGPNTESANCVSYRVEGQNSGQGPFWVILEGEPPSSVTGILV